MRNFVRLILVVMVISSVLPMASAQSGNFNAARGIVLDVLNAMLGFLAPFLEAVIGDYTTSEFFFSKVLVLILLTIIIAKLLEKTPIGDGRKGFNLIVSVLISVLAVRFINENSLFEAIFIQYGVLGVAITTILPMVIFFYFVHNTNVGTYGRKMFWGIYAITLGAIWLSKSSELPEVANWIYALTFIAAIGFIAADNTIHSYFGLSDFKKFEKKSNKKRIREAHEELDELKEHFAKRRISFREFKEERRALEDYIRELSKE
jgi:branched-subunit amino acid transport protein AzlD